MPLNLNNLNTPGVYIDEVPTLPPSVAAVATAIPAFVGYTEIVPTPNVPLRITTFQEFVDIFGGPNPADTILTVTIRDTMVDNFTDPADLTTYTGSSFVSRLVTSNISSVTPANNLYYSMKLFYSNGGGDCWVVSAGTFGAPAEGDLTTGVNKLADEDEPTMIVVPEAKSLSQSDANTVYAAATNQAAKLMDRFVIMDVRQSTPPLAADVATFQGAVDIGDHPEFAAAYTPFLETNIDLEFAGNEANILIAHQKVTADGIASLDLNLPYDAQSLSDIMAANDDLLARQIGLAVANISMILPPSGAMAGIYTRVDNDRGVWKAPANVSVARVIKPTLKITDDSQGTMNIDPNGGKSVNAIRAFTGRGILSWGARTLNGNDNEWRYVSVRRFFNFVEESAKKASARFVFEPNDANTWNSIRAMIENFLIIQWKQGALQGTKAEDAFFVKVGLGQTMTAQDILEGRLIIEIGMAVVRPAEFIILRFMHKLPES